MTDTAIPIPDDTQERMAALTQQIQAFSDELTRALAGTVRDAERGMQALSRALTEHAEASAQRQRVRTMMPALTVRQTMVHGYVPYKEA